MGRSLRARRVSVCLLLATILCGIFTGCQDQEQSGLPMVSFICKDLSHYWFQQVAEGIQNKCLELNITYETYDVKYDDDACLDAVEDAIAKGTSGIMICTTNQELGPEIARMCEKADVPLLTVDDTMEDENNVQLPHVGMAAEEMGILGGMALSRLAEERGFFDGTSPVKIVELDVPALSVFRQRLRGYEEALFSNTPLTADDVICVNVRDGMYEGNYAAFEQYLLENKPDPNTKWIVCGVNDDSALAPMHSLVQYGVSNEQILACGLGGYELSITEFENKNYNYITAMTQPYEEGAQAVQMLYDCFVNDIPMEGSILLGGKIATCDNYLIYFNYEKLYK